MSWSIGLHLGEHFADLIAFDEIFHKRRIFYQQMNPEAALQQTLQDMGITTVSKLVIHTEWPMRLGLSHLGGKAAVLITAGFENWLELCMPIKGRYFSRTSQRAAMPIDHNLFFGVSERVTAEGQIEKPVDENELEFLVSKLQLHEIKNVAVCYLHSNRNNENENRTKSYLEAKGFRVFMSSQCSSSVSLNDERTRFWSAIINAYVFEEYVSRLKKVQSVFEPFVGPFPDCAQLGSDRLSDVIDGKIFPLASSHSYYEVLAGQFARTAPLFFAGLEAFVYFPAGAQNRSTWDSPFGPVALSTPDYRLPRIQPMTVLSKEFVSPLCFSDDTISFDRGPIVFGRGLTPTFLGLVLLKSNHTEILGVADRWSDRGRSRLIEQLSAYSRNFADNGHLSGEALANQLFDLGCEIIRDEIQNQNGTNLQICGPLAAAMAKPLKATLIDDEFMALKYALNERAPQ